MSAPVRIGVVGTGFAVHLDIESRGEVHGADGAAGEGSRLETPPHPNRDG